MNEDLLFSVLCDFKAEDLTAMDDNGFIEYHANHNDILCFKVLKILMYDGIRYDIGEFLYHAD